jgi:cell division protein FtsL
MTARAAGARTATAGTTSTRTTSPRPATARTTTARTTSPRPTTPRTTTARTTTARSTPTRPELRLVPGAVPARSRRQLPVVVANHRAPFVVLVVALLVGTTLGLLVLNTAIAVDSLKATSLKAANAQRAQEVQRLQQEVTTAGTPQQIADAAKKAGLIPAGNAGYLVIGPDGHSTLRGTPEPAAPSTATPGVG